MVRPAGFEPTTYCSGGSRSIQMSYGRVFCLHEADAPRKKADIGKNIHNTIAQILKKSNPMSEINSVS